MVRATIVVVHRARLSRALVSAGPTAWPRRSLRTCRASSDATPESSAPAVLKPPPLVPVFARGGVIDHDERTAFTFLLLFQGCAWFEEKGDTNLNQPCVLGHLFGCPRSVIWIGLKVKRTR